MASDINSCQFTGRLTKDADLGYTNSGTAYAKFSLAVNEKSKDYEHCNFLNFIVWGKFAETIAKYLTKGKAVAVESRVKQEKYEVDGQTRYSVNFVVKQLKIMSSKNENQEPDIEQPDEDFAII